eukprot:gene7346-10016_t
MKALGANSWWPHSLYKVQHHSYLGKVNCAMGPSSLKNWGVEMY